MNGGNRFLSVLSQKIVKKLREAGATSIETAKTIEELKQLGLSKPCTNFLKSPMRKSLARLTKDEIKETEEGRYYVAE